MAFGSPILDREAEVKAVLEAELSTGTLQRIREEGIPFDRWNNFRKRYHWQPVFMYGNEPRSGAQTKYFNGEGRSEEHTSELQSRGQLVCGLLLEKKKKR